ncbi:MAG: HDOD domain-containing protein, partial [Chromatiales bacterium]
MDNPGKKLNPKILSDQDDAFTATEIISDDEVSTQLCTEDQLTQTLLNDLDHGRLILPSLPDIAIRVGREMNEENTNARKLAYIIQTDPVITAKLIRTANSPLYAGVSPVDSCTGAVIRLGASTTHNLVLTFALRELFVTQSPILKTYMQQLWKHSVKVSAICYVLAKVVGGFNPERALLAGLLHDIGVVAILNYTIGFP